MLIFSSLKVSFFEIGSVVIIKIRLHEGCICKNKTLFFHVVPLHSGLH